MCFIPTMHVEYVRHENYSSLEEEESTVAYLLN